MVADLLLVSHNSLKAVDLDYIKAAEVVFDGTNGYGYLSRIVDQLKKHAQRVYVVPWDGAYVQGY